MRGEEKPPAQVHVCAGSRFASAAVGAEQSSSEAAPRTCTCATEKSVFGLNEPAVANLPPTPVLLNLYYGANLINSGSWRQAARMGIKQSTASWNTKSIYRSLYLPDSK